MSSESEFVYPHRNNAPKLRLSADNPDINFAAVTRVDVIDVAGKWEVLSTTSPAAITWSPLGKDLKVVLMFEELANIPSGNHVCRVVVYDAGHPKGIIWGTVEITLKEDVEVVP